MCAGFADSLRAIQQGPAQRQFLLSFAVGQKAKMTDVNKARGQHVKEKTTNKLDRIQGHRLGLIAVGIELPFEGYPTVLHRYKSPVGNGDPVRVSGQVLDNVYMHAEAQL